jgi:predicted nucleotide-binding protein
MASSYSTDLKLELQVTGENAGTWGDITNTNLVILQQSIAGYSGVSIAGGAGNTDLTFTNGLQSNGKNAVIELTGTITGNRTVTITTASGVKNKVYVIRNSTSGAFTVTVLVQGQTGVTFSATDKGTKILYLNGTDVVDSNIGKLSNDYTPTLAANLSTNSKNIQVASTYGIIDENSNPQVAFTTTASATNGITIANGATGTGPTISATGGDTNINLNLASKGTLGRITLNNEAKIFGVFEAATISTTFLTTFNYDVLTQAVYYDNSTDTANHIINLRGDSTTSLNAAMNVGETVTVAYMNVNGNTTYYNAVTQVDGTTVTAIWQGGSAPTTGNASSTDVYTYTALKTAASTFTVFASQTQFK